VRPALPVVRASRAAQYDGLGDVGRKLHTERSRNVHVATNVRLWVRNATGGSDGRLAALQRSLISAGERQRDVVLPGYTHLQRAQPVLAGHYFLAYVEKFARDRDRLADALRRVNVLPLGAAALAGTTLPIYLEPFSQALSFDGFPLYPSPSPRTSLSTRMPPLSCIKISY